MKQAFTTIFLTFFALANSALADVITLSERQCWLGEEPDSIRSNLDFFGPDRIGWIEAIIDTDPALHDTVTIVEQFPPPNTRWVMEPHESYTLASSETLDSRFLIDGYDIYANWIENGQANSRSLPLGVLYMPKNRDLGFKVSCGVDVLKERIRVCLVLGKYEHDAQIRLKARLYFPDFPASDPEKFRNVIDRFRELVYCLDVTDELVNVRLERPTLSGCSDRLRS